MGFTRSRIGRNGAVRFQALYDDAKGVRQSAGTFMTEREADKAWQRAEAKLAEGKLGDPRRGRQTFKTYVEEKWLSNHEMEPSTRESYTRQINKHIMPEFGPMKMLNTRSPTRQPIRTVGTLLTTGSARGIEAIAVAWSGGSVGNPRRVFSSGGGLPARR
jgi:Phage integrase, N-terminal SAM-like domain